MDLRVAAKMQQHPKAIRQCQRGDVGIEVDIAFGEVMQDRKKLLIEYQAVTAGMGGNDGHAFIQRSPQPHRYLQGEQFWYLGKAYPLKLMAAPGVSLRFDGQQFVLARPTGSPPEAGRAAEAARASFVRWYQAAARKAIGARAEELASRHGLSYERLRITSARTRWGSCSSRRTLSFAWRLVMAPPEIVDYVVTHELAHLAHPNHAPAFWQAVAAMLPDFAPRRAWLKKNGMLFSL